MNNEPMSDERLARIRDRVQRVAGQQAKYGYSDAEARVEFAVSDAGDLLAEVDRLRAALEEREGVGSCWDEGPEPIGVTDCDRVWLRCSLPAGHAGAHRDGRAQWMSRDPYNQVVAERDEAQAALARVTDDRTVLAEVRAERKRQVDKGYTPEHDDHHGVLHLLEWADRYGREGTRRGLVKAAALTLAAIEAYDRVVAAGEQTEAPR